MKIRSLSLSKNPRELERVEALSSFLIVPGGVYGGHGTIFAAENLIFQSKNRFLAVLHPKIRRILARTGWNKTALACRDCHCGGTVLD